MDMHQFWRRKSSVSGNAKEIFYALWELAGFKPGILYDITMTYLAVLTEFTVDAIEGRIKSLEAAGFIVKTNTGRGKFQIEVKNPLAVEAGENDLQNNLQNAGENHGQIHRENPPQNDGQNHGKIADKLTPLPEPPRADHTESKPRPKPSKQPKSRKSPEKTLLAATPQKPISALQNKPKMNESTASTPTDELQNLLASAQSKADKRPDKMSLNRPGVSQRVPARNIAAAPPPKPVPKPKPSEKPSDQKSSNSEHLLISNISIDQVDQKIKNQVDQLRLEKQQIFDEVQSFLLETSQLYIAYMVTEAYVDGVISRETWDRMRYHANANSANVDPGKYINGSLKRELKPMNYEIYKDRGKGLFRANNPKQSKPMRSR